MNRTARLLELGCEIARKEQELASLRAAFVRMVETGCPPSPRRGSRKAPLFGTIKARALACFDDGLNLELPASTIVKTLAECSPPSVFVALSKLTADRLLVRVRYGVYRLP
jgi:hypothetical protein